MSVFPKNASISCPGSSSPTLQTYLCQLGICTFFFILIFWVKFEQVGLCQQRITVNEIKNHPWFLKNLPRELTEANQAIYYQRNSAPRYSMQSKEEIMKIVAEAKEPPPSCTSISEFGWGGDDEYYDEFNEDDNDKDKADRRKNKVNGTSGTKPDGKTEEPEEEDEYAKTVRAVHASGEFGRIGN